MKNSRLIRQLAQAQCNEANKEEVPNKGIANIAVISSYTTVALAVNNHKAFCECLKNPENEFKNY